MSEKIEITHKTIFFTIFLLLGLWFLYYVREVLFQLLVSFVIVSSFNPFVTRLERNKFPRTLAVAISYIIFLGISVFSLYILAPSLVSQTGSFVKSIPDYISKIGLPVVFKEQILQQLLVQLGQVPSQIAKTAVSIFSNVLNVVTVLILSFYLLLSREKLNNGVSKILGGVKAKVVISLLNNIENRIGMWAKAELLLMFIVGSLTYVGLLLLRVPYALPLALLAGMFEIVPIIGPFTAAIPAVVIGFSSSFFTGIATASLAFLIQQIENYVIVPNVMQKSAGVNPVVTLLALSIGFRIQGVAGAIIAIPVVLAISVLIEELILKKE